MSSQFISRDDPWKWWRSAETGGPLELSVINNSDQGLESTGRRTPVSALKRRHRRVGRRDKWSITYALPVRRKPTVESDGDTYEWQVPQRIDRHVTPSREVQVIVSTASSYGL